MPIQVSCPECQRPLRVPDHLLGTQVRCPGCQAIFRASTGEAAPLTSPAGIREDDAPPTLPAPEPSRRRLPPKPLLDDRDDEDEDDDFDYRPSRRRRWAPHRGGMILTFGILSIVGWLLCAQLPLSFFGIAAWIMGHADLKEIKAGRMDPAGEGLTRAGWILGIIGTVLLIAGVVGCMMIVALGGIK